MEIRAAAPEDCAEIRDIAADSFRSGYSLSPQQIETLVETEFSDERLHGYLDDPESRLYVAKQAVEGESGIHGFVHAQAEGAVTIRWLHVDTEARGLGVGTALFERVTEAADGETVRAWVFEEAVQGGEFCTQFGLERSDNDWLEFGTEEYAVAYFGTDGEAESARTPTVEVPDTVAAGGADRRLDRDEPIPGREAPFFQLYTESEDDPYGYFCSQCGSTDVSADGLDRLTCGECGNIHNADEWDASYL